MIKGGADFSFLSFPFFFFLLFFLLVSSQKWRGLKGGLHCFFRSRGAGAPKPGAGSAPILKLAKRRPCLDHRIFRGIIKESVFLCFGSRSSVWNEEFVTSFPVESFLHLYVLEENKNPLLRYLLVSFPSRSPRQ